MLPPRYGVRERGRGVRGGLNRFPALQALTLALSRRERGPPFQPETQQPRTTIGNE